MIDISLSYLVVNLYRHDLVAGLDIQLDAGELLSIAVHTLLPR